MTTAVIYVRVSSSQQSGNDHVSLASQEAECRKLALSMNFTKFHVFTDIGSAAFGNKLTRQMAMIKNIARGQTIFCYSYDRFSRNVIHGMQLIDALLKKGVVVRSVTEPLDYVTPAGRNQLQNVFNSAELSSNMLSQRVSAAIRQIREDGGCPSAAPYGHEIDPTKTGRKLRVNPLEQKVIAFVRNLRSGNYNIDELNYLLSKIVPADRPDLLEPFEITDDHTGKPVNVPRKDAVSYANIAEILTEWQVPYRGIRKWNTNIIKNIIRRNSYLCLSSQKEIAKEVTNRSSIQDTVMVEAPTIIDDYKMTELETLERQLNEMRLLVDSIRSRPENSRPKRSRPDNVNP